MHYFVNYKIPFILFTLLLTFGCSSEHFIEKKEQHLKHILDLSYKHVNNVQSPIDLQKNLAKEKTRVIDIKIRPKLKVLLRKAHTIELKISEGSYIKTLGHEYDFKQLHFHTPAEHSIDKITHPMEMHIVSIKLDSLEPDLPKYLVIGITFKEGEENPFVESIIKHTTPISPNDFSVDEDHTKVIHENQSFSIFTDLDSNPIDLNTLFGDSIENHLNHFIHYKGSLTTHPYTESVEWYVLEESVSVSKSQIEKMKEFMGENARVSQEKTHLEYGFDHMFD